MPCTELAGFLLSDQKRKNEDARAQKDCHKIASEKQVGSCCNYDEDDQLAGCIGESCNLEEGISLGEFLEEEQCDGSANCKEGENVEYSGDNHGSRHTAQGEEVTETGEAVHLACTRVNHPEDEFKQKDSCNDELEQGGILVGASEEITDGTDEIKRRLGCCGSGLSRGWLRSIGGSLGVGEGGTAIRAKARAIGNLVSTFGTEHKLLLKKDVLKKGYSISLEGKISN